VINGSRVFSGITASSAPVIGDLWMIGSRFWDHDLPPRSPHCLNFFVTKEEKKIVCGLQIVLKNPGSSSCNFFLILRLPPLQKSGRGRDTCEEEGSRRRRQGVSVKAVGSFLKEKGLGQNSKGRKWKGPKGPCVG